MATQYTPTLKLALPVQGELSGSWGDVVNDNKLTDTGTALTGAGTVICPDASKLYTVRNSTGQIITLKTASGSGIAIPDGHTAFLYCDATNVVESITSFAGATTFAGTVSSYSDASSAVGPAAITLDCLNSYNQIEWKQAGSHRGYISADGADTYMGAKGTLTFRTGSTLLAGGTTALALDTLQNATFAGKTCFDGTLYSDLYAAGSTIQLGNQFFVSEVAANRADMLLGMTLNAASSFESTGTIKPSGIVLQDGSIILAVDGTTRTVGSAAAATARLTITDTSATFAGSIDVGNDADVTGSATTGYIQLNGNAYNGWISMDASSLHIGHNTSARNLVLETNSTAALTINGSQNAIFAGRFVTGGGAVQTYDFIYQPTAGVADPTLVILDGVGANVAFFGASAGGYNAAACTLRMGKNNTTGRTINAGGTINASGADFAEYRELIPALYNNTSAGDLLGYNSEGLLTNIFADVTGRFCIKSTSPAYVGNDIWGDEDAIGSLPIKPDQEEGVSDEDYSDLMAVLQYELDKEAHAILLEAARIKVDRIAIAGIVPVNVTGITVADVGTYLVPISNEDGTIGAIAIDEDNLTLKQYIKSFGAVERIDGDVVMAAVKTC
jgi:hypothetical protein